MNYNEIIKNIENKEDMKKLVNKMFKDEDLSDVGFSDFIYEDIIPKLREFGVNIESYNEETNESGFEVILKENY